MGLCSWGLYLYFRYADNCAKHKLRFADVVLQTTWYRDIAKYKHLFCMWSSLHLTCGETKLTVSLNMALDVLYLGPVRFSHHCGFSCHNPTHDLHLVSVLRRPPRLWEVPLHHHRYYHHLEVPMLALSNLIFTGLIATPRHKRKFFCFFFK